jgi:transcriptional regulator with XRE-family HTH domain
MTANGLEPTALTLARVRSLATSGKAREIRAASRLSLREVAASVGVSAAAVCRWELGQQAPERKAALRWAALLDALSRQLDESDGPREEAGAPR